MSPAAMPALALVLCLPASLAAARANSHGLDPRNFDKATASCQDFFQHANGGWLKANPIPASYSTWSLDNEIGERNLAILRRILQQAAANPGAPGSATQKIGDFYTAAMDESAIDKAGVAPLKPDLEAIAALDTPAEIAGLIFDWQAHGRNVLFDFAAQPDLKHSDTDIGYAGQGGLGLPDRDDYLRQDTQSRRLRTAYRKHVAHMLERLGDPDARTEADWVLALETTLARASLSRLDQRDPSNSYHMVSLAETRAQTPNLPWTHFFRAIGRTDVRRFSLAPPRFFTAVDRALNDTPPAHWRAYLRWRLIDTAAPYLDKRTVAADFDFNGRVLHGARQNLPRWKRAVRSADSALGELLGQVYVADVFPPQAKRRALTLVDNLKRAMRARIAGLAWMSEPTRKAALAKLDSMVAKIGYPDHWRDYTALHIRRDSYLANMRAADLFEARRQFAKLDRPVDRDEWDMTPQTVNAYYNPLGNEIVFPAAQLLPPYFDAHVDDALNYGAIGAVIGHEMIHAFDDEGSRFDAAGNLNNWWTPADRAAFEQRTQRLVRQFDAYVPVDDLHINGKLTLGENIADLGGLRIAYDAFKLTAEGKTDPTLDGLTADQRFFLSFAQSWRTAQRPAQLRLQVRSNVHAPAKYRVNGPLGNLAAFARAFSCKPGDAMRRAPAQIAEIW